MADIRLHRDLPVLKAAVAVFDRDGDPMDTDDIAAIAGLDNETVQRAVRALSTEPFFDEVEETANGDILSVRKPRGTPSESLATGRRPNLCLSGS